MSRSGRSSPIDLNTHVFAPNLKQAQVEHVDGLVLDLTRIQPGGDGVSSPRCPSINIIVMFGKRSSRGGRKQPGANKPL